MQLVPFERLVELIGEKSEFTTEQIQEKIDAKIKEFSGLISKEGAAHVIANELGVNLVQEMKSAQKIKDVQVGAKNAHFIAQVIKKYETRTFEKNDTTGKVGSILVGDETGIMRVTFWHGDTDKITELKEGENYEFDNTIIKDNQGRKEATFMSSSSLKSSNKVIIVRQQQSVDSQRKKISEIETGQTVTILATVVQAFKPNFYVLNKESGRKILPTETFDATIHDYGYVMNLVIDDGTGVLRTVFFRDQAREILGITHEQMVQIKDTPEIFEDMKTNMLGMIVKLTGRIQKNQMFERDELVVNDFDKNPDPVKEMEFL